MVAEWIANIDVNGEHRLQSWVLSQAATPSWAQGIVVLDAAHVLANDPEEGMQHEERPPAQPAVQEPVASMSDEQDAFEKVFKLPDGITRFDGGYAPTSYSAWSAQQNCYRWEGWKARSKLCATPPAKPAPVPEGMKLVPVEPTNAMVAAYDKAQYSDDIHIEANNVWASMVNAATPAQQEPVQDWKALAEEQAETIAKMTSEKYPFAHIRIDASEAEKEGALRDKLIELGWTPPAAQPALVQEPVSITQIAESHGRRVGNLWHFDDLALSIFASKAISLYSHQHSLHLCNLWRSTRPISKNGKATMML